MSCADFGVCVCLTLVMDSRVHKPLGGDNAQLITSWQSAGRPAASLFHFRRRCPLNSINFDFQLCAARRENETVLGGKGAWPRPPLNIAFNPVTLKSGVQSATPAPRSTFPSTVRSDSPNANGKIKNMFLWECFHFHFPLRERRFALGFLCFLLWLDCLVMQRTPSLHMIQVKRRRFRSETVQIQKISWRILAPI